MSRLKRAGLIISGIVFAIWGLFLIGAILFVYKPFQYEYTYIELNFIPLTILTLTSIMFGILLLWIGKKNISLRGK